MYRGGGRPFINVPNNVATLHYINSKIINYVIVKNRTVRLFIPKILTTEYGFPFYCKRFASPADPPEIFGFLGPGYRGTNSKSKK